MSRQKLLCRRALPGNIVTACRLASQAIQPLGLEITGREIRIVGDIAQSCLRVPFLGYAKSGYYPILEGEMKVYPDYLNIIGDTIWILVTPEQWNNMSKKELARVRRVAKKIFVNARKELKQQLPKFEIE